MNKLIYEEISNREDTEYLWVEYRSGDYSVDIGCDDQRGTDLCLEFDRHGLDDLIEALLTIQKEMPECRG